MMKTTTSLGPVALLLLAPLALAGDGEMKTVRGTNIRLLVPEGFAVTTTVQGFQSIELRSTLMVNYIPRDLAMARRGFTKETIESRGWTFLSRRDVKVAGGEGLLLHFEVPQQGVPYRKWVVLFEDRGETRVVAVHGVYPKEIEEKIGAVLEKCVRSAHFADQAEDVRTKASPFTLKPVKPLVHVKEAGPGVICTEDGVFPLRSRDKLFLIAAPSTSSIGVADRKGYAEKRAKKLEGAKDVKISNTRKVEIDGLPGFEVQAKGKDAETGATMFVYLVILYEEVQYYVIAGLVKYGRRSKALSVFRKTAQTFQREK
jgi:hypothetical protein